MQASRNRSKTNLWSSGSGLQPAGLELGAPGGGDAFFFFWSGFGGDLDDILSGHGFGGEGKEGSQAGTCQGFECLHAAEYGGLEPSFFRGSILWKPSRR